MPTTANSIAQYSLMLEKLHEAYLEKQEKYGPHLYKTSPDPKMLYAEFITGLPIKVREEHNCRACADFIQRTGHLVFISPDGEVIPAYWDAAVVPKMYKESVAAQQKAVAKAPIVSQFYTDRNIVGVARDEFPHFHIRHNHAGCVIAEDPLHTVEQAIAFSMEDHKNLLRSLFDFNITLIRQVKHLIDNDQLPNGHLIADRIEWLLKIQIDLERASVNNKLRKNIVWRYVATAPEGWCAVRGSIIGSLFKDMKEGRELADIIADFKERSKSINYMRPTAAPTEGNLNRAEKIIAALDLAPSLARRYAALSEVPTIWAPAEPVAQQTKGGGVFAGLRGSSKTKTKRDEVFTADTVNVVTFAKFRSKVLPNAKKIEFYVLPGKGPFAGVMTAVNQDAKPILQWDSEERRNPFSLYTYNGGTRPEMWGLEGASWVEVKGIMVAPWMFYDEDAFSQHSRGVVFILEDARDSDNTELALFPNTLRSELHEIRATIEAYSETEKMGDAPEGQLAQGLFINSGTKNAKFRVKVTTDLGVAHYSIDRWD